MAGYQDNIQEATGLIEIEATTLAKTTPRPTCRSWARKAAVAATLLGAVGLGVWALKPIEDIETVAMGPSKVPDIRTVHKESMEAFEQFRKLMDPDESKGIPAVPSPDDQKLILDNEAIWDYQCFLDFYQSSGYFAVGVNALHKIEWYANQSCDIDHSATSGCAIWIETAISIWLWQAQYYALAASSCTHTTNVKANCAADIIGTIADLIEAIYTGQSMASTCSFDSLNAMPELPPVLQDKLDNLTANLTKHGHLFHHGGRPRAAKAPAAPHHHGLPQRDLTGEGNAYQAQAPLGRRLEEALQPAFHHASKLEGMAAKVLKKREARTGKKFEDEDKASVPQQLKEMVTAWKDRKTEIMTKRIRTTACVLDLWGALGTFMRGTKTMLGTLANGCDDPEVCAISIMFNFASWSWTAQTACSAASDCNYPNTNANAACAGDSWEMTASIVELPAYLMVMPIDCEAAVEKNDIPVQEIIEIQEADHRRLSAASHSDAAEQI